jgi:hypothetical protein
MKIDNIIDEICELLTSLVICNATSVINGSLHFEMDDKKEKVYRILERDYREDTGYYSHKETFQEKDDIEGLKIEIQRNKIIDDFGLWVFWDVDHFLRKSKNTKPNGKIYIFKEDKLNILTDTNSIITEYDNYLVFVTILNEIADIKRNDSEFIIYSDSIRGTCIEIDKAILINDYDGISRLASYRKHKGDSGPDYSNEFNLILKNQICEICNRYKTTKISQLLEHFEEHQLEVMRNFHMFLSNFSFQKIKNTFIQEKSKYIEVLDKYVSTVQNVIFSIPISIGFTLLIKNIDSSKIVESIVTVIAFIFYTTISIIIILQNKASISITENILEQEKMRLLAVSTCNGLMPAQNEFEIYFKLFSRKISLVKILSRIIIVTLIILSFFFAFKVMVSIPEIHNYLRKIAISLENYAILKYVVYIMRFLF